MLKNRSIILDIRNKNCRPSANLRMTQRAFYRAERVGDQSGTSHYADVKVKRDLADGVTTPEVDDIYEAGRRQAHSAENYLARVAVGLWYLL